MPSHDKPPHSAGLSTPELYSRSWATLDFTPKLPRHTVSKRAAQAVHRLSEQDELPGRQRQDVYRLDALPDAEGARSKHRMV